MRWPAVYVELGHLSSHRVLCTVKFITYRRDRAHYLKAYTHIHTHNCSMFSNEELTISIIISIYWLLASVTGYAAAAADALGRIVEWDTTEKSEEETKKRARTLAIWVSWDGMGMNKPTCGFMLIKFLCFHFSFWWSQQYFWWMLAVVCGSAMLNWCSCLNENTHIDISCICGCSTIHMHVMGNANRRQEEGRRREKTLFFYCHLRFYTRSKWKTESLPHWNYGGWTGTETNSDR